jgi:hypothetical protein
LASAPFPYREVFPAPPESPSSRNAPSPHQDVTSVLSGTPPQGIPLGKILLPPKATSVGQNINIFQKMSYFNRHCFQGWSETIRTIQIIPNHFHPKSPQISPSCSMSTMDPSQTSPKDASIHKFHKNRNHNSSAIFSLLWVFQNLMTSSNHLFHDRMCVGMFNWSQFNRVAIFCSLDLPNLFSSCLAFLQFVHSPTFMHFAFSVWLKQWQIAKLTQYA